MIYFCADDYGLSPKCNDRIEKCIRDGVLNKVSVLPSKDVAVSYAKLKNEGAVVSLHLNLVEGVALTDPKEINLLASDEGFFKHTFIGLFLKSISFKSKKLEGQIYKELLAQIRLWKSAVGTDEPLFIDSHQHTHMIPLVFRTLMKVIEDEAINVGYLRIPAEPVSAYIKVPKLYFSYSPSGIIKQWLLDFFAVINKKYLKKSKIRTSLFLGVMFSGKISADVLEKLLPMYMKYSKNTGADIEIALHPGYVESDEKLPLGCRKSFYGFYYSPNRKQEFDTLIKLKEEMKEGLFDAVH